MNDTHKAPGQYAAALKALRRYRGRIHRVVLARRKDLEMARLAPEHRLKGEVLLTYLNRVPRGARRVALPDPHAPEREIQVELNPAVTAQANAAAYFKQAGRAERALEQVPSRLAAAEREEERIIQAIAQLESMKPDDESDPRLADEVRRAVELIPAGLRTALGIEAQQPIAQGSGRRKQPDDLRAPSARLQPRRLKSTEGWEVLIGRNNEGNDYLTLHIARPDDYWFHVHGAAGSHVVLRRGKGKNEPSKRTIEEVAAWAAFHSQARSAGRVPVIVTRKKYVRKPRGAKPGLVTCEREKTVFARPAPPPTDANTS